ncbi:hypothetical protein ACFLYK_04010 [Candidatus Cloacimonadota bacterium]
MVCSWGMSEKIGPMTIGKKQSQVFLGRDISQQDNISEETAKIIDQEIRNIVSKAHDKATDILKSKRALLDKLSLELLEEETLNAEELYKIILESIDEDEKVFVQKKFEKVKEMKIDISEELFPEPEPEPEIVEDEPHAEDSEEIVSSLEETDKEDK